MVFTITFLQQELGRFLVRLLLFFPGAFSRNLLCNDTVDELNKREIIRGFRSRIIIVNYFCGGCS